MLVYRMEYVCKLKTFFQLTISNNQLAIRNNQFLILVVFKIIIVKCLTIITNVKWRHSELVSESHNLYITIL